jgi:hypothetical protein
VVGERVVRWQFRSPGGVAPPGTKGAPARIRAFSATSERLTVDGASGTVTLRSI